MTEKKHATGVIHGRFQVLHLDHLRYLLEGAALCQHLVIGITNPDPDMTRFDEACPERSGDASNPLTYYERYLLLRAALEKHCAPEEYSIVPFPINRPELYRYYVPLDAVFYLTIYDAWGRRKKALFQGQGLETLVIREASLEEKGIEASKVRRLMAAGDPWEHLVPPETLDLLYQWEVPGRINKLLYQVNP